MKMLKNLLKTPMFVVGAGLFLLTLALAFIGPFFHGINLNRVAESYAHPGDGLLLGTDNLGRDYVSMLIQGLRSSLYVGFLAGVIATTFGTFIGIYGGFKGGWVDDILNVVTNLFIVIPQFVILILISASFKDGRSLTLIALIIGCTGWTWSARSVRAQASSLKSRDHISLARINGDGTLAILFKHKRKILWSLAAGLGAIRVEAQLHRRLGDRLLRWLFVCVVLMLIVQMLSKGIRSW